MRERSREVGSSWTRGFRDILKTVKKRQESRTRKEVNGWRCGRGRQVGSWDAYTRHCNGRAGDCTRGRKGGWGKGNGKPPGRRGPKQPSAAAYLVNLYAQAIEASVPPNARRKRLCAHHAIGTHGRASASLQSSGRGGHGARRQLVREDHKGKKEGLPPFWDRCRMKVESRVLNTLPNKGS